MIVWVMWEVISNGHVCTYEPRSAQCSLPLCALCPYSVLRILCRRFMSIILFQHQAAAHALVSRRSVFFRFLLAIILLTLCAFDLFSFSFTCLSSIITFILDTTLLSSTNGAMLFCLRLYINVWMFVMCMYPFTLTCLMLWSCCCNPNPDLLLSHVVFHKLVYIYYVCIRECIRSRHLLICVSLVVAVFFLR